MTDRVGDRLVGGGSDWRKDTRDEGGAENGSMIEGAWFKVWAAEVSTTVVVSETNTEGPIRFPCLPDPKHEYMLQQPGFPSRFLSFYRC